MATARDDFTKPTIDILAKRVGYMCSNPSCRKHTVGANSQIDKFTLIGIAAHITAAAPGGPRYDSSLSPQERKNIRNGIWLCANCASLIDRDVDTYPTDLIEEWKEQAELQMLNVLAGRPPEVKLNHPQPFIEADLIWSSAGRLNRGYSQKNIDLYGNEPIQVGSPIIVFWELDWRFSFVLHNNSSYPAFNIKVEYDSEIKFTSLTQLPKINNLPPFASLDLDAKTQTFLEGVHTEADLVIRKEIPDHIEGLKLKIIYNDENRVEHETLLAIENNKITNSKIR
jgi:hypothetical protein